MRYMGRAGGLLPWAEEEGLELAYPVEAHVDDELPDGWVRWSVDEPERVWINQRGYEAGLAALGEGDR